MWKQERFVQSSTKCMLDEVSTGQGECNQLQEKVVRWPVRDWSPKEVWTRNEAGMVCSSKLTTGPMSLLACRRYVAIPAAVDHSQRKMTRLGCVFSHTNVWTTEHKAIESVPAFTVLKEWFGVPALVLSHTNDGTLIALRLHTLWEINWEIHIMLSRKKWHLQNLFFLFTTIEILDSALKGKMGDTSEATRFKSSGCSFQFFLLYAIYR